MIFRNRDFLAKYLVQQLQSERSLHTIQREDFPLAKVGTLSRIKNDPTYDPTHQVVRAALLLADICPTCHRPLKKKRRAHKVRKQRASAIEIFWRALPGSSRGDEILHLEERP